MIEEQKTVTKDAYEKMREGNQYFIYPKAVRNVNLPLSDMSDGLGGYHSLESLEQTIDFNWGATSLTEALEFVHYAFDEDDEKEDLRGMLATMGLVDIRQGSKVKDLTLADFVSNGFLICSSREIKMVQALLCQAYSEPVLNSI